MIDFKITQEEKDLILKRRELFEKRQKNGVVTVQKQEQGQVNQPKTGHCDPCKVHQGRVTNPDHPMHWFEKEIFSQITNMEHQTEHRKIITLLKMPVQASNRDRIYHQLCHLDVLWTTKRLPLHYKKKYEAYKKEHNIGDDNIHPDIKVPGKEYPKAQAKRPWNPELYKEIKSNEKFSPHQTYVYSVDEENDKVA